ncbi:MAG: hypothetical protein RLZZ241_1119 [Bacteroidota bacterium]|jgi:hypothetical protein
MKNLLIVMVLLVPGALVLRAQDRQAEVPQPVQPDFSYLMADVTFMSDAVFMGRRDSVPAPYLMPSLGFFHKSGLFVDASFSYLISSEDSRVDLAMFTGGFTFDKNRFSGSISGTVYFFNDESNNVRSENAGNLSGQITYDWGLLESSLSAMSYYNREGQSDFFTGITLGKTWINTSKTRMIRPSVSAYAGTQYFYEAYYNTSRLGNRSGTGRGNNNPETITELVTISEVSSFKLMNLEFSIPVYFLKGHIIGSMVPSLSLPQSPATVTGTELEYIESLSPVFYLGAGISYWF